MEGVITHEVCESKHKTIVHSDVCAEKHKTADMIFAKVEENSATINEISKSLVAFEEFRKTIDVWKNNISWLNRGVILVILVEGLRLVFQIKGIR